MSKKKVLLRFCVVNEEERLSSSVWMFWQGNGKRDIYFSNRPLAKNDWKKSVHESGVHQVSPPKQMRKLVPYTRWKFPTPLAKVRQGKIAVLFFPRRELSEMLTPLQEDIVRIPVYKDYEAVAVYVSIMQVGTELTFRDVPEDSLITSLSFPIDVDSQQNMVLAFCMLRNYPTAIYAREKEFFCRSIMDEDADMPHRSVIFSDDENNHVDRMIEIECSPQKRCDLPD